MKKTTTPILYGSMFNLLPYIAFIFDEDGTSICFGWLWFDWQLTKSNK